MPEDDVVQALRSIERRVLEDVHIGGIVRCTVVVAALVLTVSAVRGGLFGLQSAAGGLHADWLPVVATSAFVLACAGSVCALTRKRFRWSCCALYLAALAVVTGLAAVWSQQTGPGELSWWAPLGVLAGTGLALAWSNVVAIPLDRSQPDMRAAIDRRISR
jgi:hypothetical protein